MSDKTIHVSHIRGYGVVCGAILKTLGHNEIAEPNEKYFVDHYTALILGPSDPFFKPYVSEEDALEKFKKNKKYICLVDSDCITETLLEGWLELYGNAESWPEEVVDYIAGLSTFGQISDQIMKTHHQTLLRAAMLGDNTEFFKEVLTVSGAAEVPHIFWTAMRNYINEKKDISKYVEAITQSKVNTFLTSEFHISLVAAIVDGELTDKYYDLIAFMSKIYYKYNNDYFFRGIRYNYGSLVSRLRADGILYDGPDSKVITTQEELAAEISAVIKRYKPATEAATPNE